MKRTIYGLLAASLAFFIVVTDRAGSSVKSGQEDIRSFSNNPRETIHPIKQQAPVETLSANVTIPKLKHEVPVQIDVNSIDGESISTDTEPAMILFEGLFKDSKVIADIFNKQFDFKNNEDWTVNDRNGSIVIQAPPKIHHKIQSLLTSWRGENPKPKLIKDYIHKKLDNPNLYKTLPSRELTLSELFQIFHAKTKLNVGTSNTPSSLSAKTVVIPSANSTWAEVFDEVVSSLGDEYSWAINPHSKRILIKRPFEFQIMKASEQESTASTKPALLHYDVRDLIDDVALTKAREVSLVEVIKIFDEAVEGDLGGKNLIKPTPPYSICVTTYQENHTKIIDMLKFIQSTQRNSFSNNIFKMDAQLATKLSANEMAHLTGITYSEIASFIQSKTICDFQVPSTMRNEVPELSLEIKTIKELVDNCQAELTKGNVYKSYGVGTQVFFIPKDVSTQTYNLEFFMKE